MKNTSTMALSALAGAVMTTIVFALYGSQQSPLTTQSMPYQAHIAEIAAENEDFRHVLFTGALSQLVVMSIPPGEEVGEETHANVEQTLFFQSGSGEAILDGVTTLIAPGDVVVVTPGTVHNFRNTGKVPLKIITTYAPPNHIDGRVQHTKADADADVEDEAFDASR